MGGGQVCEHGTHVFILLIIIVPQTVGVPVFIISMALFELGGKTQASVDGILGSASFTLPFVFILAVAPLQMG